MILLLLLLLLILLLLLLIIILPPPLGAPRLLRDGPSDDLEKTGNLVSQGRPGSTNGIFKMAIRGPHQYPPISHARHPHHLPLYQGQHYSEAIPETRSSLIRALSPT
eukprot:5580987-Pyramimonas_sp.AAC.1